MQPRAEHLDEVEQARVGPVEVLEDEHVGRSRATASMKPRTEKKSVSRSATDSAGSSPSRIDEMAGDRLPLVAEQPLGASPSFASATSRGSLSKIPASCFSCAANAP